MDITITIPEPVAHTLQAIAAQRGISLETLTQQALVAGVTALQTHPDATAAPAPDSNHSLFPPVRFESWSLADTNSMDEQIVQLGALHPEPLTDRVVFKMPSPIISPIPVTPRILVLVEDNHDTGISDED